MSRRSGMMATEAASRSKAGVRTAEPGVDFRRDSPSVGPEPLSAYIG